jgi:arylsulfatase A-like enzyme
MKRPVSLGIWPVIATALLAATAVAIVVPAVKAKGDAPERLNVVLISIDTLRADHLSCYGYDRPTSPAIDQLAREGTLFRNAQSASSWTTPSHMTMMTGLRPSVHGVDRPGRRLAPEAITLAEVLHGAGYETAAFVGGPTLSRAFGFDRGFERYQNFVGLPAFAKPRLGGPSLPPETLKRAHDSKPAAAVGNAATAWLTYDAHAPFFLFVHLWDPHYDYEPPTPYDRLFDPDYDGSFDFHDLEANPAIGPEMAARERRHLVALYDGEIAWTDSIVGRILQTLDQLGLRERTLVVLTSDHGEEFLEHGGKGHLRTLYQEIVHVPLIFRAPGLVPANQRADAVFGPAHLMPTILGLVGLPAPPDVATRDLSALVKGGPPDNALWAFSEVSHLHPEPLYLVRIGELALMGGHGPNDLPMVFNVRTDPGEVHARTASPAKARVFQEYVDRAIKTGAGRPASAVPDTPLDDGTITELRALGYLVDE